ncbi:lysylphosphatidylglycerol synthase transmembrane domain-containing protein [Actinomadura rubrisoli]|uniref:Flippase-like domain-containing protein n=1 Tax=Actinomadura rubrisoli TaxID=2530368 RepID=A0A4R5AT74_9ACTN|nr:lysylphosphatidylglycerol synthase domain-containing protein [Actinomadura rubrisoli]TDD75029.1 flippase-like domain-containing protein [Actinomadura rubrisoli]
METIAAGAERAAPAKLPVLGGDAAPTALRSPSVQRLRWTVAGILLTALATVVILVFGPGPLRPAATAVRHMRWGFLPALLLLSLLHYVFAALALRGASGRPLPLHETTLTQFTAAAANRITPGGLGAVAVNTRYLVCRGMPLPRAAVAVAVLQVAGVPADLILIAAVLGLGGGNGRTLDAMGSHAAHAAGLVPAVPLLVVAGCLLPAAVLMGRRAARSPAIGRAVCGFADLCRRPRDLALTLGASAGTTLVLGLAFALSVLAVPQTEADPGDILALLAAYLVGAAAGSAVPSPGGVGSTEATLVAALAALGIPAGPALQAVLLFRVITFWAPVPVGLLACRTLRR